MNNENEILKLIKRAVLEIIPDASIILFGSRARKDFDKYSDWDILVLTNEKTGFGLNRKLRSKLFQLEFEKNISIGSLIQNRNEWEKKKAYPIHMEVDKDGIEV
jgi:predicted nucleotidyltransferase